MESLKWLEDFVMERIEGFQEKRSKPAKEELYEAESEYKSLSKDYVEIAEELADFVEPDEIDGYGFKERFLDWTGKNYKKFIFVKALALLERQL